MCFVCCLCLNKKRNKLFFCVYVSYVSCVFMCIQQQLTTLKNNDLLFCLYCLYCLFCLYSVYTYKQQQTPKILFSLFFIFFFCFFSLFLCFLFFLSFAAPQDYYTPVYVKIRPIFFPSFSTFFLRPVYESLRSPLKSQGFQWVL